MKIDLSLLKFKMFGLCLIIPLIFMVETALCFSLLPYYKLDGFSGRVIDVDTGESIGNALVLIVYYKESPSIAGSMMRSVDCRETLTDGNGEFSFEKKTVWFGKTRGQPRGQVSIFKPGYGTLWHRRSVARGVNISWPPPNQYIVYEIPCLNNNEERKLNLPYPLRLPENKWPILFKYINEERLNLGCPPIPKLQK